MTPEELEVLVRLGESEVLELKQSTGQRTEAAKTVCAMLNNRGGRVVIGVTPDKRIIGQQLSERTIEEVTDELRLIDPPAFPTIERVPVSPGHEVLILSVNTGRSRPYVLRGKAYRRVGNTNRELSRDEYNVLLLERVHGEQRWENEDASGFPIDELDEAEIVFTVEEAIRRGRLEDPGTRDPTLLLRGLSLVRDGNLLKAAVALFGRANRLQDYYPQFLLRVARFRGTDRTEFTDNRQFRGNIFDLLRQAERFLRETLPVAGRVAPGLFERIDDPLYPPIALREALANAFCHREYGSGGGSVGLAVYDDRLEITSTGMLHFGLTPAALFEQHESLPWNPLIAGVLYRRGIIEQWGRGTLKMAELAESAGLPRPEIEALAGAVVVRFRSGRYSPPTRVARSLTERQQQVLALLAPETNGLAFGVIRSSLSPRPKDWELKEDLGLLRQLGLVTTRGHARGARWLIA